MEISSHLLKQTISIVENSKKFGFCSDGAMMVDDAAMMSRQCCQDVARISSGSIQFLLISVLLNVTEFTN